MPKLAEDGLQQISKQLSTFDVGFFDKKTNFTSPTAIKTTQATQIFDEASLYSYGGEKLGWVSRYPTYSPLRDNEDYFGGQQSGLDKGLNALATAWFLTKNTFVNGLKQYGRDFNALESGDFDKFWNDAFTTETAKAMKAVQNLYPIYETKEQQALRDKKYDSVLGNAWGSVKQFIPFTGRAGNAWANLAGQLGFTAGVAGQVVTESAALALLTVATESGAAPIAAVKTAANIKKLTSIKSMWNLLKESRGLMQLSRVAGAETNLIRKVTESTPFLFGRSLAAATGEASIESASGVEDFKADQIEKYIKTYGKQPDEHWLAELDKEAIKVGNNIFGWNIPVLLASNYFTINNLFKPSNFTKSVLITNPNIRKGILEETKILTKRGVINDFIKSYPKLQKGLRYAEAITIAGKENISEGIEGFLQGVGSRSAQHTYDMFNSDKNKGVGAFLLNSMSEAGKSFGTKEGWDEFTSGFLTGFGIKGFNGIINRVVGKNKIEKNIIKKGVEEITQANSRYINLLTQISTGEKAQESINKNDIKTAKDTVRDAEISLFDTLSKYGVVEDYLDELEFQITELEKTNPSGVKEMLKDRTAKEAVDSVRERFITYDNAYQRNAKQIGNPYKEGTDEYNTWDSAIRIASSLDVYSKDSFSRAKKLQDEIFEKYNADATIISAAFDPTTLPTEVKKLQDYIQKREESLQVEGLSEQEKSVRREEINKDKQKLKTLEKIQEKYYDEKGNLKEEGKKERQTQEAVSTILKGMYGSEATAPAELKQMMNDMLDLENEGHEFLTLYNILSNPENFEKFGKSYVKKYLSERKNVLDRVEKEINDPTIEPTDERYTEDDFDKAFEDTEVGLQGEAINQLSQIQKKIDDGKIKRKPDGKLSYEGKDYTEQELFEKLLEEHNAPKEILKKSAKNETVKEVINKRFNDIIAQVVTTPVEKRQEEVEKKPDDTKNGGKTTKSKPKSKIENEKESFVPMPKSGHTILHYFEKALAKVWKGANTFSFIEKRLRSIKDDATWNKIETAFKEFGSDAQLTTLYLVDDTLVFGVKDKNEINKSDNVRVVSDGIRYFIITKGNNASKIIEQQLSLKIEKEGNTVVLKDLNGNELTSPFKAHQNLTDENQVAIHNAKRGDILILEVTSNSYNEELFKNETDHQKIIDRVHISAKNSDGVVVGVLRAGDFLFESTNNKSVKKFRSQLLEKLTKGELIQGAELGQVQLTEPKTTRNKNFKDGKIDWINLEDFKPEGFKKTFFYVRQDGTMIDEDGKEVKDTDEVHDRRGFNVGAIYMKIEKKNGINHTSQIYRSDINDADAPVFTEQEFIEGRHLEVGQTDLNPQNPIVSKRLEIKLKLNEEISNVKNANEEKQQQFDEIVKTEEATSSLEAKKADIEKRRQEELKSEEYREKVSYEIFEGDSIEYEGEKITIRIITNKDGSREVQLLTPDRKVGSSDRIPKDNPLSNEEWINTSWEKLAANIKKIESGEYKGKKGVNKIQEKINAKYDAELAALEKEKSKTVIISDTNGNEKQLNNAQREGNVITSDEGKTSLNDVEQVKESSDNLTKQLEQSVEWEKVKNSTQEEIEKWIIEKGQEDIDYILLDGTVINVEERNIDSTYLSITKNGFTQYVGYDKKGRRQQSDKINDLRPKNYTEPAIIQKLKQTFSAFGLNADATFKKLKDAYDKSIQDNQPIQSLSELVEKGNLTAEEQDAFDNVITPIWYSDMWTFITESEEIYDQIAEEKWQQFKQEINLPLSKLETLDIEGTPKKEYEKAAEEIAEEFDKVFRKTGISIIDFPNLVLTAKENINKLISAIRKSISHKNIAEGIISLMDNLIELGLRVEAATLMTIQKVDKKTLGRRPIKAFDLNSIYTDLMMSNVEGKQRVRNESDGYFVEVSPSKEIDKKVLPFQKQLLSLLGIKFPISYLQGYLEVNGNFEGLKIRALVENKRQQPKTFGSTKISKYQVTSDDNIKNYYGIITTSVKADVVELGENKYFPIMQTNEGEVIYLRADKQLTAQQLRNAMQQLNIPHQVPKRLSNLGSRMQKIKGLNKQIEQLRKCD